MKNFLPMSALVSALLVAGCGNSAESICAEICDCEGCSESDEQRCVKGLNDSETDAEGEGCAEQYDEYVDCALDGAECIESKYEAGSCRSQAESLGNCLN